MKGLILPIYTFVLFTMVIAQNNFSSSEAGISLKHGGSSRNWLEITTAHTNVEKSFRNLTTTETMKKIKSPEWVKIMDSVKTGCSVVGCLGNIITFITLSRRNCGLGRAMRLLLCHQSVLDGIVCMLASILMMAPPMWKVGIRELDIFFCHFWHSQAVYWFFYLVSVWNLVLLSIERLVAVTKPLSHETIMSNRRIYFAIACLHVLSLMVTSLGFLQTRFEGGQCVSKYAFDSLKTAFYFFGFVVFAMWHFLPAVVVVCMYGKVISSLRGRLQEGFLPKSNVIESASKEITRTVVTVTIIFILSTSYDLWYYLLGRIGLVVYIKGSVTQKIGVFLSIINCCANPFVYICLMPAYRRKVIQLLTCRSDSGDSSSQRQISYISQQSTDTEGTTLNIPKIQKY